MDYPQKLEVLLIEDDYVIREVIGRYLGRKLSVYSSDNGVEGLGYLFIGKPSAIIIDTTLPKYDGLEVIEYIYRNNSILEKNIPLIVLFEGNQPEFTYPNIRYVSKSSKLFLEQLYESLALFLSLDKGNHNWIDSIANIVVRISNFSDRIQRKIEKNSIRKEEKTSIGGLVPYTTRKLDLSTLPAATFFMWIFWILTQILLSFILIPYTLFKGNGEYQTNLNQKAQDNARFRVRYYPVLATYIISLLFLVFQVLVFILGGVAIFNIKSLI